MRYLANLILLFSLSSCATLVLKRDYNVSISTNLPNAKAQILDSTFSLPANLKVKRSKDDLKIELIANKFEKEYIVKSSPNASFLYGNLIGYPIFPVMYGIDLLNQKRFYYGKCIYLNSYDIQV